MGSIGCKKGWTAIPVVGGQSNDTAVVEATSLLQDEVLNVVRGGKCKNMDTSTDGVKLRRACFQVGFCHRRSLQLARAPKGKVLCCCAVSLSEGTL